MGEWRTIGQLADLVGAYCWVEHRLFTLMGAWAVEPVGASEGSAGGEGSAAERTVFLAAASLRHGALAEAWRDRLPVRAGVERGGFVVAPGGPLAPVLDRLAAEPVPSHRLAGLTGVVLPRLVSSYEEHIGVARAASEGPVLMVLEEARREAAAQTAAGQALLPGSAGLGTGLEDGPEPATGVGAFVVEIERAFEEQIGLFPGARAS
jgi:hypothetical protein